MGSLLWWVHATYKRLPTKNYLFYACLLCVWYISEPQRFRRWSFRLYFLCKNTSNMCFTYLVCVCACMHFVCMCFAHVRTCLLQVAFDVYSYTNCMWCMCMLYSSCTWYVFVWLIQFIFGTFIWSETSNVIRHLHTSTHLYEIFKYKHGKIQNKNVFTSDVFCLVKLMWLSLGAKTIKKNTNSTQNKSQSHCAKQYKVTSFLSTDCELSIETCSRNVYSLGPRCI